MNKPQSQSIRLLLALLCCLLLTLPALAQTPEPTAVATPDATAQASATPEAEATDAAPVIIVESEFTSWYIGILSQLIDLIKWTVVAAGGYAITKAWRNPEQGKQYVSFGLGVFELVAKLTPTKKDDELFRGFREWWESIAKETKEVAAQAAKEGVKELIEEERSKLAVNTFNIVPPHNPVS
jgi:hypothetical protein